MRERGGDWAGECRWKRVEDTKKRWKDPGRPSPLVES